MTVVLPAGTVVRIKNDPGRSGVTTGKTRARGDDTYYQVHFPEGRQYLPGYELEEAGDGNDDVYDLIAKGRYGMLNDFRRNLTQIQLSGRLANLVYSMDTTNTDFYAYQYKPVLSFLESPSNGLLIADEVGLGKTIEAGLIWTELRARFDARRLLVVCPAMLCEKWRRELDTRFAVRAEVMSSGELLRELAHDRHAVADGKAVICSIQGIRPPRDWEDPKTTTDAAKLARFLRDAADSEPLIDMVIVDESHYLRNPETQAARLGALLRDVSDAMVLLSATPINLKSDDLFHQLRLVDPDFFGHERSFPEVLAANEPLVRARAIVLDENGTAEDVIESLQEAQEYDVLADNAQLAELIDGAVNSAALATPEGRVRVANRIERINLLAHAVTRTRKRDVRELRVVRAPHSHFVAMSAAERDLYDRVTDAIVEYALAQGVVEGFLLAGPQRRVASCMVAAVRSWQHRSEGSSDERYEDFGSDDDLDGHPLTQHIIRSVLPHVDVAALESNDTKYAEFRRLVLGYLNEHPDEKMVVFSYFPATLEYLAERMRGDGIHGDVLHGSTSRPKDEVIDEFRGDPRCRILFSSEVASEGVDLQFCRVLVNYDLPWNPMKVEQRIGRIDRVGQHAEKVSILNLGHADTIDERIYQRLLVRLKVFEQALGGMEALLGEQVRQLTSELFTRKLTAAEQQARIDQTAKAVEANRQQQDELEQNASSMIAHGGYILEQVQAAYQFKKRVTSRDLEVYVHDYLAKYASGYVFRQLTDDQPVYEVKLSPDMREALDQYMRRHRLYGQSRLATGDVVRCRFRNRISSPATGEEVISQLHPLVRYISADLKARNEAYHQLVALRVSRAGLERPVTPGIYVFAVQRWSFAGLREEEVLRARAINMDTGAVLAADDAFDVLNSARVAGDDWPAAKNRLVAAPVEDLVDQCSDELAHDFDAATHERKLDNQDRVNFQIKGAERHRDRQVAIQKRLLDAYRAQGRTRLVPAIEGKIRKLNGRFEDRVAQLRERSKLEFSPFPVCFGVLDVE